MASSSEAFEKFETWKKSKTQLRVTLIVSGETTQVLEAKIFFTDPEAGHVGIAVDATRKFGNLDVGDATFSIEASRLVATRNESDWLIFEEI